MKENTQDISDKMFEELINKINIYHSSDNTQLIKKAYVLARDNHLGQKRKSGEPFIVHPLQVAIILAELKLDKETIAAALLHDLVEDTAVTEQDIEDQFGKEIMFLVRGVTKLDKVTLDYNADELQAANIKKILWATAQDIRVIIIKLADRLHNMQTLEYQSQEKQMRISQETIDIYAPIAGHLGIIEIKKKLEDLCLRYLKKEIYFDIFNNLEQIKSHNENCLKLLVQRVRDRLREAGIETAITIEYKHIFSIYRKLILEKREIEELYNIFSVLIIVDNIMFCYETLGVLHNMYTPIPGRFKDYIAMPKSNLYQSIHTTLITKEGMPFEVQIRTKEMDSVANYGILTKWKYKDDSQNMALEMKEKEKLEWLHELLKWQQDVSNTEYMEFIKKDLDVFSEKIYCFTPKGKVIELPTGSIAVDFAYYVHSEIGNHMSGAKINGILSNVKTILQSGDIIEILTSDTSQVQLNWLDSVKTERARNKITQELKKNDTEKKNRTRKRVRKENVEVYYKKEIKIYAKNEVGILYKISKITRKYRINILKIQSTLNNDNIACLKMEIQIPAVAEEKLFLDEIDNIRGVDKMILEDKTNE